MKNNLKLNQKGLTAYETGERATGLFKLPGIDRESKDNREYFGRYPKRKDQSKFGGSLSQSQAGPLSERINRDLPKTSEEYIPRRRYSREIYSPDSQKSNILGQPINNNIHRKDSTMEKYKSVANIPSIEKVLPTPDQRKELNDLNMPSRKNTTMLSPRNEDVPEYLPTERDEAARRSIPVAEINKPKPTDTAKQEDIKPIPSSTPKMQNNLSKFSVKKDLSSLQDIDSQLNQRVLGSMRGGSFKLSKD